MTKSFGQQEGLKQEYANLNGQEKAQFILATIIGKQIGDNWLELIKTAMTEYMVWHQEQHPSYETCEFCEDVKNNIVMYSGIKHWVEQFNQMTTKK